MKKQRDAVRVKPSSPLKSLVVEFRRQREQWQRIDVTHDVFNASATGSPFPEEPRDIFDNQSPKDMIGSDNRVGPWHLVMLEIEHVHPNDARKNDVNNELAIVCYMFGSWLS